MLPLVLSCSVCGDMAFRASHWWANGFGLPLLALLADALLVLIVARVSKRPAEAPRARFVLPALLVPVASTIMGVGTVVGAWVMLAIALAATGRSIFANREAGRLVTGTRLALVLGALIAGLVPEWPSRRPTEDLARIATYVSRFRARDGWVFDELKQRPDAAKALAARFADAEASDAPPAVRLHAAFGFPVEERAAACARLRGLNGDQQYKELEEACGEPPSRAPQGAEVR